MTKKNYKGIIMESHTKYIKFMAEDSFAPLFWDDENCGIGYEESFYIGDKEYSLSSLEGIKEWFKQVDKYDPYTDIAQFTTDGMDEWINQGYEYAKQLRALKSVRTARRHTQDK